MAAACCDLCARDGGLTVFRQPQWRVVRVLDAPDFPAFYRVVWQAHVAEFSELDDAERAGCMDAVVAIERVLLERLAPAKVNIASLGNVVPHLHWHVIARFVWDSHFPQPIWGSRQRMPEPPAAAHLAVALEVLDGHVRQALANLGWA